MRGTLSGVRLLAAMTLVLSVTTVGAEDDDCKAVCTRTKDSCLQQCGGSPDPDQCKGNCQAVYEGCLTNCAQS